MSLGLIWVNLSSTPYSVCVCVCEGGVECVCGERCGVWVGGGMKVWSVCVWCGHLLATFEWPQLNKFLHARMEVISKRKVILFWSPDFKAGIL